MYKFLLFFVIFNVVAEEKSREEVTEKCAADLELSKEEVGKMLRQGLSEKDFDRYKCFYKCILQEFEMIDSDGNINHQKMEELHFNHLSCINNITTDVCVKAYGIFKCLTTAQDVQPSVKLPSYNVTSKCYDELGSERDNFFEFISTVDVGETKNQKIKCFFKCAFMEWEWMTEDGDFINKDKIYETMGVETESDKAEFDDCFNVTGKDPCEKALNFRKCYNPKN